MRSPFRSKQSSMSLRLEGRIDARIHRLRAIAEGRQNRAMYGLKFHVPAAIPDWRQAGIAQPSEAAIAVALNREARQAPPTAPCNRRRRPRTAGKSGAEGHQQRARQNGLALIEKVDCLSDDVVGHFLVDRNRLHVVRCHLFRGTPSPCLFSHGYHEGAIGWTCNSWPLPQRNRRTDLVGDRSQRRGGGFGAGYLAHLLDATPDAGGGQDASIPSGRQMRGNHGFERTRRQIDFATDFRFVTQF